MRKSLSCLLGAVFAASGASADLFVKQKITGADGKSLGERTWIVAADRLRVEQGGAGVVLDQKRGRAWLFAEGGTACDAVAYTAGESGEASAHEWERLGAILADLASPGVTLNARGETRTIAGVEAERWDIKKDGETIQERWFAPTLEPGILDELFLGWATSPTMGALLQLAEGQVAYQSIGHGFPVAVKNLRTGTKVEAVEIRSGTEPDSAFSPPAACPER